MNIAAAFPFQAKSAPFDYRQLYFLQIDPIRLSHKHSTWQHTYGTMSLLVVLVKKDTKILMIALEKDPQTTVIAGENGWPVQGAWTYADYLRLPDDGNRYEIIGGVLYVANAPTPEHQYTVTELIFYLRQYVSVHKLGIVFTAPIEVHLTETTKPVQPDVLFVTKEQQPPPGQGFIQGAPALIVEVVSPTSIRRDRKTKFDVYEEAGVAEYWIVDPRTRSVEVYTWSNGEYALFGQFIEKELVQSQLLPGLSIPNNLLFYPPAT